MTISVGLGLAMAGKVMRRPGLSRKLLAIHEHTALAGIVAIAVHGITLLGDPWLHPGVAGITVPFAMGFRPLFTGLGIIAGYLAALLGLSFYVRKRIGAAPLAQGAPGDDRRLRARPRPRPRRRHRRLRGLVPLVGA